MKLINEYIEKLIPYKSASHKIWTVPNEERNSILKLDWNESSIAPSPKVAKRIKKIVDRGDFYNLYPSTLNNQLMNLISSYLELPKDNFRYVDSSDTIHEYVVKLFLRYKSKVLVLGPTYDNFRLTCETHGSTIHYVDYNEDFSFDSANFINEISNLKPSLVYICNPNNPTGNTHSRDFIEDLITSFPRTVFLIDEAYVEFSGLSVKPLVLKYENLIITRTFSKAFALANFRIGLVLASENNIKYISNIINSKNTTTFAQEAAIAVLNDIKYMKKFVAEVLEAKIYFVKSMNRHKSYCDIINGGGNFVMIKFIDKNEKDEFYNYLISKNIFVRNLTHNIILNKCLRITIGTKTQMQKVMSEIDFYFKQKK